MKRFRELTSGGTIIMGRKTLDSFPEGKPLPKRRNIVLSRKGTFSREGVETVSSPEEALALVADTDPEQVWLIGGGSVYATLLNHCKRVCLTRVETQAGECDTFFPNLDKLPWWQVESTSEPVEENGFTYRFIDYVNTSI
jgi:dihydrofolate reductase